MRMALTAPVSILTGGPGTGKTHTLRAVLTLARAKGLRCLLAAPTGRAAKRMEEATGLPGRHAAPAARAAPRRQGRARPPASRWRPTWSSSTRSSMLDALLANQLVQGGRAGHPPAAGRRPGPAAQRRRRRRAGRPAPRGAVPGHPPDAHLPPGRRLGDRRQRPADQRRRDCRASAARCRTASSCPAETRPTRRERSSTSSPSGCRRATASGPARSRCSPRCTAARPASARSTRLLQERLNPAREGRPGGARRRPGLPPGRPRAAAEERLRPGGLQRRPGHGARDRPGGAGAARSPSTTGGRCATRSPACTR